MSSLAERLKNKGFELPDERPPAPLHSALIGAQKSLSISSREKRQLFTPLEQRGAKAVKAEEEFKKECEKDLLKGVKKTLTTWVQDVLASSEKRQKLHEKGFLKCRVQSQWSEDLNRNLHVFVESFGGRIAASCEKENAVSSRPAWEKYAARDERWMIGFDVSAFESFIQAYPQVLGPSDLKLQEFVEEYSRKVDINRCTVRQVLDALEAQFGPLTDACKGRAKQSIAAVASGLEEERKQRGSKRKDAFDSGGPAKRPRVTVQTCLRTLEDATWAAEVLAPLGLRPGTNELAVKAPAAILAPLLESLKTLEPTAAMLRSSSLGIIVGGYRQHSSADVAGLAKELVASWKATCVANKGCTK